MTDELKNIKQSLVVFARYKDRMSTFYQRTLMLDLIEQSPTHDLLHGHGIEVVVHGIPAQYAAGISISTPPDTRQSAAFKPVFQVSDLEVVRAAAESSHGHLNSTKDAWEMGNVTVLDGWDPEGNVIQFRQPTR